MKKTIKRNPNLVSIQFDLHIDDYKKLAQQAIDLKQTNRRAGAATLAQEWVLERLRGKCKQTA